MARNGWGRPGYVSLPKTAEKLNSKVGWAWNTQMSWLAHFKKYVASEGTNTEKSLELFIAAFGGETKAVDAFLYEFFYNGEIRHAGSNTTRGVLALKNPYEFERLIQSNVRDSKMDVQIVKTRRPDVTTTEAAVIFFFGLMENLGGLAIGDWYKEDSSLDLFRVAELVRSGLTGPMIQEMILNDIDTDLASALANGQD
jgi:hypothetical protein